MTPDEFKALKIAPSCHGPNVSTFLTMAANPSEVPDGTEALSLFDLPFGFTWDEWLDSAVLLGAKAVWMTSKYHDGLTLWPSSVTPGRSLTDTAWYAQTGRDLFGEFCAGAKARGLELLVYFAVGDSYEAVQNGSFDANYVNKIVAQLTELFTDYGPFGAVFLDGWGTSWGAFGLPTYVDIPYATIEGCIHALQPGCLIMVNDHDNDVGDIRIYENNFDGEPKSAPLSDQFDQDSDPLTKPVMLHRPIQETRKWFSRKDSEYEPLQPALNHTAGYMQRCLDRGQVFAPNWSVGPDGRVPRDILELVEALANTRVPGLWRGLTLHWKFNGNALEAIQDYDLTAVGTPTATAAGDGLQFNGSSQYLTRAALQGSLLSIGNRSCTFVFTFQGTAWSSFPLLLAKYGGLTEYQCYIDTGDSNKAVWQVSRDGTTVSTVKTAGGVTTGVKHTLVVTHGAESNRIGISLDGGTFVYTAHTAGIAESIYVFNVAGRNNGSNLANMIAYDLKLFHDREFTQADSTAIHNGGQELEPFDVPPAEIEEVTRRLKVMVRALDSAATDGSGKTGLAYSGITASYRTDAGQAGTLTTEDITTLGVYEKPTSAFHARIKKVSDSAPWQGMLEVQLHPGLFAKGKKLWLALSASGASIQPLEVSLTNEVSHFAGLRANPQTQTVAKLRPVLDNVPTNAEFAAALPGGFNTLVINAGIIRANNANGDTIASTTDTGELGTAIGAAAALAATAATQATTAATQSTAANTKLGTPAATIAEDIANIEGGGGGDGFDATERAQILVALSIGTDIGVPSSLTAVIARIDGDLQGRAYIVKDENENGEGDEGLLIAVDFRGLLGENDAIESVTLLELIDDGNTGTIDSPAFAGLGEAEIWMNGVVRFRITGGTAGQIDRFRISVMTVGDQPYSAPVSVKVTGDE